MTAPDRVLETSSEILILVGDKIYHVDKNTLLVTTLAQEYDNDIDMLKDHYDTFLRMYNVEQPKVYYTAA